MSPRAIHNFSAGPAMLPKAVLERAQAELVDWQGRGISVMEMSHRGADFTAIAEKATNNLKELLDVPDGYSVLFLQGGATLQFSMAVLNLAKQDSIADYVVTGSWGRKAHAEARRFCEARIAALTQRPSEPIPDVSQWSISPEAAFVHYTPNETIDGVEFHDTPDIPPSIPLVADFSSSILSRPVDVSRFGLIYAGAQKNIGPAGLTVVIIRDDLLSEVRSGVPDLMTYRVHAASGSMKNTPPTFAWYLAGLVFEWLIEQGGLAAMAIRNQEKAERLYRALDQSDFYTAPVPSTCRSRMNVVFRLVDADLESTFLQEAEGAGLMALKGHRSVGGIRASLYNAMPLAGVEALVEFLGAFEARYG